MWLKVDHRVTSHPATLKAGNAALGLWLRGAAWLTTHPREGDTLPRSVAISFGTKRQVERLIDAHLWHELPNGDYRVQREMNVCGSGLTDHFWKVDTPPSRPAIPARIRRAVYERDGHQCVTCRSIERLSLDHIHPYSLGGSDTIDNLQTMCRSCNSRKGARV